MNERKSIGAKHNPEYTAAPYEITYFRLDERPMRDGTGQFLPLLPYRYATLEHAQAAMQPGADPRVNTVWPFLPIYEEEEPRA